MNYKKIISFVLAFSMIGSEAHLTNNKDDVSDNIVTANAKVKEEDFVIDENGVITKYKGTDSFVTIPSAINNIAVTSIGDYAFFDCAFIENIDIPDNITSIGTSAFRGCSSLTQIYIPFSVQHIGSNIFNDCENLIEISVSADNKYYSSIDGVLFNKNITELIQYPEGKINSHYNIPEGVISIADYSLYKCSNLQSVYIPQSVVNIGIGAFWGCLGINQVNFADDSNLISIGDYAFYYCTSLQSIEIPINVLSIGCSAFAECISLTSIGIPSTMVDIVDVLFFDCINLAKIYIIGGEAPQQYGDKVVSESGNLTDSIIWSFDLSKKTITINGNGEIPDDTDISDILKITDVEKIVINSGITYVPYGLFDKIENITIYCPENIYSGNNLNIIFTTGKCGENVFWEYENTSETLLVYGQGSMYDYSESMPSYDALRLSVKNIVIENGITSISDYSFSNFQALSNIKISETVSFIGNKVFDSCNKLSEINVAENNQNYYSEDGVLFSKDKAILIKYPAGKIQEFYQIPENVNIIDNSAFENATYLSNIVFTENIEFIGDYAFFNTGLTNVTISPNVKEIGTYAFGYYNSENLISQKNDGFIICGEYNSQGYNYAVNNNIQFISKGICGDNSEWKFDYTTKTLTISGEGALNDYLPETLPYHNIASLIENVVIEDGITSIGKCAFYKCISLKNVQLPESITDIGNSAFFCCVSLNNINLPNNISRIGNSSFLCCTSLTDIKIPENTSIIEDCAFYGCTSLTNVEFSDNISFIGEKSFYYCTSLSGVKLPESISVIEDKAFGYCTDDELKVEDFIIYGMTDSNAHVYAQDNDFIFVALNGKCGENAEWKYNNDNKTLSINGTGDITELNIDKEIKLLVDTIIIDDDITYMPEDIFSDFSELKTVYMSDNLYINNENINIITTGICGENLFWKHNEYEQTLTIYGQGDMYDYYENTPSFAGLNLSVKNVIIENGVTSISDFAFSDFDELTNINISETVSYIGISAFDFCNNLSEINVAENNMYYSSDNGVLFSKDQSLLIKYPAGKIQEFYQIPENVNIIENSAFENAKYLSDVLLTDNIEIIGEYAFFNTGLTNASINNNIKQIGEYAFGYEHTVPQLKNEFIICGEYNSQGYSYAVNNNIQFISKGICGDNSEWKFDYTSKTLTISGEGAINDYMPDTLTYQNIIPLIENIVIEDGITEIGECAFYKCEALKNIQLPESITDVGNSAFFCCTALSSINLPDNITCIGDSSFLCCTSLTDIKIPENTSIIEDCAFYGCTGLTNVEFSDNISFIGEKSFYYCTSLSDVKLPESVSVIEDKAFGYYNDENSKTDGFIVYGIADSQAQIYAENNNFMFFALGAKCGENVEWRYNDANKTITINGTGDITELNINDKIKNSAETLTIGKDIMSVELILPELTSLKNINVDEDNSAYSSKNGVLFNKDFSEIIKYPSAKEDVQYTLPESVTYISDKVFENCNNLQEIIVDKTENECTEMNLPDNIFVNYAESVNLNLTNASSSNEDNKIIESNSENYVTILTAKEGCKIVDIEVKVGENILVADIDYTYNQETGELIINRTTINRDVVIMVVAEKI